MYRARRLYYIRMRILSAMVELAGEGYIPNFDYQKAKLSIRHPTSDTTRVEIQTV